MTEQSHEHQSLADVCVPNLDGFATAQELRIVSNVFGLMAAYADHKARAMDMRAKGDIECLVV